MNNYSKVLALFLKNTVLEDIKKRENNVNKQIKLTWLIIGQSKCKYEWLIRGSLYDTDRQLRRLL